jgi:hypothetical protein
LTQTITVPAAGHAKGNLLVLYFGNTTATVTGVIDARGNSYLPVISNTFWASVLSTALISGDLITVTLSIATGTRTAQSAEFNGMGTSVLADVAGVGASGSSTTPASGSITPVTINVLLLGQMSMTNTTAVITEATSWSAIGTVTNSSTTFEQHAAYRVLAVPAAVSYTPTLGTSSSWFANIAALRVVSVPVVDHRTPRHSVRHVPARGRF